MRPAKEGLAWPRSIPAARQPVPAYSPATSSRRSTDRKSTTRPNSVALIHEMKPQTKAEFEVMRDNQPQKIPVTIGSRASEYGEGQFGPGQGQVGPDPNALQRIEDEMHQLRDEIRQLREQLQKK